ncbi:hypothetical protein EJ08DRAFT_324144 [Tothia fuscella]|uniref:Uncharacterized protein n=1 Tax=Tothia fuscella TaxID=1048955 RepID=A0A9P4NNB9_9PEZI|nr:hypothetical protein EJ08DRAFT_324144 [Tothia fuscella]
MSEYDYDDRPRRRTHRTRDRSPEYVETTYIQRGTGQPSRDLVFRGREDSIEEIDRDFPPPSAEYRRTKVKDEYPPRSSRSSRGGPKSDYYDDDYYSDYGPPAAAAAGYAAPRRGARPKPRRGRSDDDYYSDDYDRPRRDKDRKKSGIQETLEGLGLGGAVAAITGKSRSKSRSRRGSHGSDSDRDSYRSSSRDKRKKWQQAAKAAVVTGVIEAVRSRNEPGAWTGQKGQRVATAALGAAAADGLLDRNPNEKSKRHIIESVVGGLAANRLANGPRDRSGSRGRSQSRSRSRGGLRSRSRSLFRSMSRGGRRDPSESPDGRPGRSQSRGRGLKEVAALGGIAAAGKAIYDRVRSKSRGGRGKRSPSASSEDSYVPARRQQYQGDRDRGPPRDDDIDDRRGRSERGGEGERGEGENRGRDSSSDSVSTTDLEQQRKKTRGKELLTAGLATVATIHAAHGVYESMVASEKRHKLVMEGEMSPEEARKRKSKNMLQDAAAVGIAALGLKSVFGEWKEMNEHRQGLHELEMKRRKRKKMREKRQKEMLYGGQNAIAYPYPGPNPGAYGPTAYSDGNPYANQLPPPPMGSQPPQRY